MPEPEPAKRTRAAKWSQRIIIIALGLSLGLAAKWIKETWQARIEKDAPAVGGSEQPGK